ncbi:MAG TPA: 5-(carboxyamino)imidazole ribonucleotide mutase [Bacteroidales bacterium]|jgi:5-(carboxyamino)imidazole ribonucleotide mutase|nr:5-(carboxyamino)imidazole ribonucleotide mutase [Bacteroidales bacterium]HOS72046.1 5-(carboxyamino)imidazole ribonucleotide mutase [Bacteroidales bacterium]HQH24319.1 5-(carboxyamino)imidazole ribonucleotide mutase [Bacteroidales bacterium]HQJ81554.1 5-(carboxyamino)imidazole ribonucleotide mutase [Bacteroidales bacterium]
MKPLVSIIMGSLSDLDIMEKTAQILNDFRIPFEINALSAHRTPGEVEEFARSAADRGIRVIIAAAGMAAHLPGVIAAMTPLPVIGVPINASLEGLDSIFSILQMPPGVPVATVGVNAAQNAGILAAQIIAAGNKDVMKEVIRYKEDLKKKIVSANEEIKNIKFPFKTN